MGTPVPSIPRWSVKATTSCGSGRRLRRHACHCRRQRFIAEPESLIARAEARLALVAMVIGTPELHVAQRGGEGLQMTTEVASLLSMWTCQVSADVVRVEPLLNGPRRHGKCPSSRRRLDSFKVEPVGSSRRNQPFNFVDDLRIEGLFESLFLASSGWEVAWAVSSWKSAHCSQAPQKASTCLRNWWPASTCARTSLACSAETRREVVRPPASRVRL